VSLIDWFAARRKDQFVGKVSQDTDEGDGLWVKCSECSQVAYRKDLISNFNVCSNCGHHNRINSDERINIIADKNSFKEFDSSLSPTDPLGFKDRRSYADRIKESQAGTGLRDGVITGFCSVNSMPLALAVMDFRFMGGSMGSVVGEKITRIIERATIENYPILIVCASGGARMQEGMLSLMQIAKISGALKKHKEQNKLLEAQRLEERTKFDLEMIEATGSCAGIENYSRFLSGRKPGEPPPTLFEYFPDNTLIFVDECHVTVPQLNGMFKGDRSRKSTLAEYGFRLPSCMDNRPLKFEEWDMMRTQTVFVSATPGPWELEQTKGKFIDQVIRPTGLIDPPVEIRPAKNQVDDLMHECKRVIENNHRVLVTTLTKKMAEDLTEYLHENGIKVRYLHSDIDTLERIEIMRDLRMGVFDVLVGINLLREGLDIPECALVGILDADKEGFLRSETSLIQTIGRAARNVDGKVILYADKETKSIKKAIAETDRRRQIQLTYNKKHKIDAKSVKKEISDILESVYEKDYVKISDGSNIGGNLKKHLKGLDKKMKESAANLEFEEAAKIRDEIRKLESTELEITLNPKIRQYDVKNKLYPKGRSTMGMPGTKVTKKRDKKWKHVK